MHPIDKKSGIIAGIIIGISLIITIFCICKNVNYSIAFITFAIAGLINDMKIMHRLVFLSIINSIGLIVLLLVENYILYDTFLPSETQAQRFTTSFLVSILLMIIVFIIIYFYYIQIIETLVNEKKYFDVISNFPNLICSKHFTRTKEYSMLGYKGVTCRIGKKCLRKKDIIVIGKLIGIVGIIENGKMVSDNYYVTLWDHRRRKIRYGDYDIIEIHQNDEIKDYDYIISKIITFFYNEINRYKPLNEVIVRIVGVPDISENTIRMMRKHFLKLEYFSLKQ